MNLKDLKNMDKDEMLGLLGLETKQSTVSGWPARSAPSGSGCWWARASR